MARYSSIMATTEIQIRSALPSDAGALADIHALAWREAYLGIIPAVEIERTIARRGPIWWLGTLRRGRHIAVIDFAGELAGYASFGPGRVRGLAQGEVYELYMRPEFQGVGLGRKLFEATRNRLAHEKLTGLVVWSLTENERACGFYSAMGGKVNARAVERLGDVWLDKHAYMWS